MSLKRILGCVLVVLISSPVFASENPIASFLKISGTDAYFEYDIYTNLNDEAGIDEIDQIRPELNARLCNVTRAWKLEMADARILSKNGKQIGAAAVTKWDCSQ